VKVTLAAETAAVAVLFSMVLLRAFEVVTIAIVLSFMLDVGIVVNGLVEVVKTFTVLVGIWMAASVSDDVLIVVVASKTLLIVVVLILMLEEVVARVWSFVTVETLVDVNVGVVNFLVEVVVLSMMMITKTSEMIRTCFASMMMISTSATVIVAGGDHMKDPVFSTCSAISVMITVVSFAPAGTRWMFKGAVSPVVSHEIVWPWLTGHWAPTAGLEIVARAEAAKPKANADRKE
jgi:hypothetical protein